ncbi:MAG: dihydroorotase, partial [Candidatus Latescibacteria bacterium]|nr:dihydroorotase [Candidatus Latescibacterota bacterium]
HVHLREPGFEHKETIASGTVAAAAGGICAVAAMPNTHPPPDTAGRVEEARRRAAHAPVRVYPIACITLGRQGKSLAPLAELARAGAVAFSDDGDPVEDEGLMRSALELGRQLGIPLFPHEEVKAITAGGCMHEGQVSARLGVKGMPAAGEEALIARDLELVRQTGGPLHIAHISTAGTVELVRQAKAEGLPVTCEVLTHHFALTDEEVARQGTQAKMSPPLRSGADVQAMLRGLAEGVIDTIATDHAPHSAEEKKRPLEQAPFGIVGLETAVGLTLTHLVHTGVLDLFQAIEKWTWAPSRILRLPGGHLSPGGLGDVTIIDPNKEWTVDASQFRSKSRNTPFNGYKLKGKAVATVVGGKVVYSELGG